MRRWIILRTAYEFSERLVEARLCMLVKCIVEVATVVGIRCNGVPEVMGGVLEFE